MFGRKKRDFVISITKLFVLMIFEWEFGCLWLQKQAFGNGSIAKINFRRKWISYDSRVDFAWFWVALEAIFMAFVALEAGLKTHDFSWWFWGHPGSWAPGGLRVSWSLFRVCMYVWMYTKPSNGTWDMRHEKWEIDHLENPKCIKYDFIMCTYTGQSVCLAAWWPF